MWDQIVAWIDQIASYIPGGEGALAVILAGILDFLARTFPTKNPAGIVHAIAAVLKGAGAVLASAAGLVVKAAAFLDKVLGQNMKPAELPPDAGAK